MMHRFLHMHSDKVFRELQALPALSVLDEDHTRRTTAWESVSALLLEIGMPMEVPRFVSLTVREHSGYRDFMHRNANRNPESVKDIFVKLFAVKVCGAA